MSHRGGKNASEHVDDEDADVHVLHVDDDPGLLDLASTFVEREREGFRVTTATDAETGLELLEDEEIDCVVSDYDMPGVNGLEFLEAVRECHPSLPFLLFTGKGSEEIASEAISAGVTEYLQKGTGTDQYSVLANRIDQSVSRRRAEAELAETKRRQEVLLSNLPGMVYRCATDPGWPMEFVSSGISDLVGYDPDQLVDGGISWEEDVIHTEDRDRVRSAISDAIEADDSFEITYRIRTAGGERRWVWEQGRAIAPDDRTVLEGFITDVTDRKRRQQRLEALDAQFRAVLDSTDDAVLVVDLDDDRVVETNLDGEPAVDWTARPASELFEAGLDPLGASGDVELELAVGSGERLEGSVTVLDVDRVGTRSVFVGWRADTS